MRVADAAVIVVCAVSGLEVGVEKAWGYAEEQGSAESVLRQQNGSGECQF